MKKKACIICAAPLDGRQRLFCSNRCKQQDKNERVIGRRCAKCHKPIKKPVPVMGGYSQQCSRVACNQEK